VFANYRCHGRAINITYLCVCVCVFVRLCLGACACAYVREALLIQHATRMRHIMKPFVAPQSPPYVSTLSHKRYDFRGGGEVIEHKMCVLIFCTVLSKTFLILSRIQRDIVISVKTSSCKVQVIIVGF
jgi:hypothetical protein